MRTRTIHKVFSYSIYSKKINKKNLLCGAAFCVTAQTRNINKITNITNQKREKELNETFIIWKGKKDKRFFVQYTDFYWFLIEKHLKENIKTTKSAKKNYFAAKKYNSVLMAAFCCSIKCVHQYVKQSHWKYHNILVLITITTFAPSHV